jgi:hypothetical protein
MPTFVLFKNGEKVKDTIGAIPAQLKVCASYLLSFEKRGMKSVLLRP